jgi:hypothetical protein
MRGETNDRLRGGSAADAAVLAAQVPLGRFLLVGLQLALGLMLIDGCADDSLAARGTSNESRAPEASLEPYGGRMAELFDDAIEPTAVGFAFAVGTDADPASVLRERTQAADAVVRARIVTVTSGRGEDGRGWQVGLKTIEPLAGGHPPETFSWLIRSKDPAAGIVRAGEGRVVGATVIAFLRDFAVTSGSDGRKGRQIHFHAANDSKTQRDAVRASAALGEFR